MWWKKNLISALAYAAPSEQCLQTSKWDVMKMNFILQHAYAAPSEQCLQTSKWDVLEMKFILQHANRETSACFSSTSKWVMVAMDSLSMTLLSESTHIFGTTGDQWLKKEEQMSEWVNEWHLIRNEWSRTNYWFPSFFNHIHSLIIGYLIYNEWS